MIVVRVDEHLNRYNNDHNENNSHCPTLSIIKPQQRLENNSHCPILSIIKLQ